MGDQPTPGAPRIAILCGSAGGDLRALLSAREAGLVGFSIVSCFATSTTSTALAVLGQAGADPAHGESLRFKSNREEAFGTVARDWETTHPELVFLCGFPFLLPAELVRNFSGRIINSHPSILPAHPGLFRKEELAASHDKFLGATVHRVDEGMDTGPILAQAAFPNYGLQAFDRVLRTYRFIQDVLMVQVFRDLVSSASTLPAKVCGSILFSPGVDEDILHHFLARHELS